MYKQVVVKRTFKFDYEDKVENYQPYDVFIDNVTNKINELSKDYTICYVSYPDMYTAVITYKEKRKRYGKVSSK